MRNLWILIVLIFVSIIWASNPADLTNLYRVMDPGSGIGVDFSLTDVDYDGAWGYTGAVNEAETRSGYLYITGADATLVGAFSFHKNASIGIESVINGEGVTNTMYPDIHGNRWGIGVSVPLAVMSDESDEINFSPRVLFFDNKLKVCIATNLELDEPKLGLSYYGWLTIETAYQLSTDTGWLRISRTVGSICPELQFKFYDKGTKITAALYF